MNSSNRVDQERNYFITQLFLNIHHFNLVDVYMILSLTKDYWNSHENTEYLTNFRFKKKMTIPQIFFTEMGRATMSLLQCLSMRHNPQAIWLSTIFLVFLGRVKCESFEAKNRLNG